VKEKKIYKVSVRMRREGDSTIKYKETEKKVRERDGGRERDTQKVK
jgi:hypothetical protein